jgi:plasmid stability protein
MPGRLKTVTDARISFTLEREQEFGMTLTIELPDEQTAALSAKARAQGLSAEEYARQVLQHDLAPEWLQKSWKNTQEAGLDRLSMEEIDAEIAAARKARRESRLQPGA